MTMVPPTILWRTGAFRCEWDEATYIAVFGGEDLLLERLVETAHEALALAREFRTYFQLLDESDSVALH